MNRILLPSILILSLFLPFSNSEASLSCSKDGHTVIYINGILNTKEEAEVSLKNLIKTFRDVSTYKMDNIIFKLGYNPSRYAGVADTVQAAAQSLFTKVTNFDRDTILMQIHPEINTQKILLVGHSQGSFYANEIYRYLIEDGLPKESVGVYLLASPASEVADTDIAKDGDYLTSTNDNLIWEIRGWTEFFNSPRPLEPNILIPISNPNVAKLWRGHSFSGEYLAGAPAKIVRDIDEALGELRAEKDINNVETGCFNPPQNNFSYKTKKAFFAATDPVITPTINYTARGIVGAYKAGSFALNTYDRGFDAAVHTLGSVVYRVQNLFASAEETGKQGKTALLSAASASPSLPPPEEFFSPSPPPFSFPRESEALPSPLAPETSPTPSLPSSPPVLQSSKLAGEEEISPEPALNAEENNENEKNDNLNTPNIIGGGGGSGTVFLDSTAPSKPVITSPSDFSAPFTNGLITFEGTAESGATVSTDFSNDSVLSANGLWSLALSLEEGTTTVTFYATDSNGNRGLYGSSLDVGVQSSIEAPAIVSPASFSSAFSTSTITFEGTSEAGAVISQDFSGATTTAGAGGLWSLTLSSFPEGDTALGFAGKKNGLASATTTVNLSVDTIPPAISLFEILECQYSLSPLKCLSGTETINLQYGSDSTSPVSYKIYRDGKLQKTTSDTATTISVPDGLKALITVVATDGASNTATSSAITVNISKFPIVINEIAWAGTTDSSDEWVELYNRTALTLDLFNVALVSADGVPEINFSGTIGFRNGSNNGKFGHYLIERTASNTTSMNEDLAVAFSGSGSGSGLSNTHEELRLVHYLGGFATSTLDSTPPRTECGGVWCAGLASTTPFSMERIDPNISGAIALNWATNDGLIINGTDSNGNNINGTPMETNSASANNNPIGYYCEPKDAGFLPGGYYAPTDGSLSGGLCTYISPAISGKRHGYVFKGTVGNSTEMFGHFFGLGEDKTKQGNNYTGNGVVQGESFFTAIFEVRTGPAFDDLTDFRSYFTTGSPSAPPTDYGILEWKYGEAP